MTRARITIGTRMAYPFQRPSIGRAARAKREKCGSGPWRTKPYPKRVLDRDGRLGSEVEVWGR